MPRNRQVIKVKVRRDREAHTPVAKNASLGGVGVTAEEDVAAATALLRASKRSALGSASAAALPQVKSRFTQHQLGRSQASRGTVSTGKLPMASPMKAAAPPLSATSGSPAKGGRQFLSPVRAKTSHTGTRGLGPRLKGSQRVGTATPAPRAARHLATPQQRPRRVSPDASPDGDARGSGDSTDGDDADNSRSPEDSRRTSEWWDPASLTKSMVSREDEDLPQLVRPESAHADWLARELNTRGVKTRATGAPLFDWKATSENAILQFWLEGYEKEQSEFHSTVLDSELKLKQAIVHTAHLGTPNALTTAVAFGTLDRVCSLFGRYFNLVSTIREVLLGAVYVKPPVLPLVEDQELSMEEERHAVETYYRSTTYFTHATMLELEKDRLARVAEDLEGLLLKWSEQRKADEEKAGRSSKARRMWRMVMDRNKTQEDELKSALGRVRENMSGVGGKDPASQMVKVFSRMDDSEQESVLTAMHSSASLSMNPVLEHLIINVMAVTDVFDVVQNALTVKQEVSSSELAAHIETLMANEVFEEDKNAAIKIVTSAVDRMGSRDKFAVWEHIKRSIIKDTGLKGKKEEGDAANGEGDGKAEPSLKGMSAEAIMQMDPYDRRTALCENCGRAILEAARATAHDWVAKTDPETGDVVWVNSVSGECVSSTAAAKALERASEEECKQWTPQVGEDGSMTFVNAATGEVTTDPPKSVVTCARRASVWATNLDPEGTLNFTHGKTGEVVQFPALPTEVDAAINSVPMWEKEKDAETGAEVWVNKTTGDRSETTPAVVAAMQYTAEDWIIEVDPETGEVSYINKTTGEVTYQTPRALAAERATGTTERRKTLPAGWTEKVDPETGETVYENESSGVVVESIPDRPESRGGARPSSRERQSDSNKKRRRSGRSRTSGSDGRKDADSDEDRSGESDSESCRDSEDDDDSHSDEDVRGARDRRGSRRPSRRGGDGGNRGSGRGRSRRGSRRRRRTSSGGKSPSHSDSESGVISPMSSTRRSAGRSRRRGTGDALSPLGSSERRGRREIGRNQSRYGKGGSRSGSRLIGAASQHSLKRSGRKSSKYSRRSADSDAELDEQLEDDGYEHEVSKGDVYGELPGGQLVIQGKEAPEAKLATGSKDFLSKLSEDELAEVRKALLQQMTFEQRAAALGASVIAGDKEGGHRHQHVRYAAGSHGSRRKRGGRFAEDGEESEEEEIVVTVPWGRYMKYAKKGVKKKVQTVVNALSLVYDCYEKKMAADLADDVATTKREGPVIGKTGRESLPAFVSDFLLNKFGLPSLRDQWLFGMVEVIAKHSGRNPRLRLFGVMCGVVDSERYNSRICDVILHLYTRLFKRFNAATFRNRKQGECFVSVPDVVSAINAIFSEQPISIAIDVMQLTDGRLQALLSKIQAKAVPYEETKPGKAAYDARESATGPGVAFDELFGAEVIDIDVLSEMVVETWLQQAEADRIDVRKHFETKVGGQRAAEIDRTMFEEMIQELTVDRLPAEFMLDLFKEASVLNSTGEPTDLISSQAFEIVCGKYGITRRHAPAVEKEEAAAPPSADAPAKAGTGVRAAGGAGDAGAATPSKPKPSEPSKPEAAD